MSARSRLRWRMSSCANANGMAGSSAQPIAIDAPSGTKRATASAALCRLSVLPSLVVRLPLLDERLDTLASVLALEEPDKGGTLDGQSFLERHAEALHRRVLDLATRIARAARELLRQGCGARLQLRRGDDLVDDPCVPRLLRRERRPTQHQAKRLLAPDEPREPLRSAGAGEQAERDLGETDLVRALSGDAEVAAQRDLEAATQAMAVDRGDDDLRRALEL